MANAAVTPTLDRKYPIDVTERYVTYYGTLVVAPGPDVYVAGGNTLSFAGVSGIQQAEPPVEVRVWSETVAVQALYNFAFLGGTTNANGKLAVTDGGAAPLADLAAGAIPAAISGDTKLRFMARFVKGR